VIPAINRLSVFNLFFAAAFHFPAVAATALPGSESAILTDLDESSLSWINPSRIVDSGNGFDFKMAAASGAKGMQGLLHFPAQVALGIEYAIIDSPYPWYSQKGENSFLVFSLAKGGFGKGPLENLRLGISARRYNEYNDLNDPRSFENPDEEVWAMDGGASWDLPIVESYGSFKLGLYSLQTLRGSPGSRQTGLQLRWLLPDSKWRFDGNLILNYPGSRQEWPYYWVRNRNLPDTRLAMTYLFKHVDMGAMWLPAYNLGGMTLDVHFQPFEFLPVISFGTDIVTGPGPYKWSTLTIHLDAKIRFVSDPEVPKDLQQSNRTRNMNPKHIVPDSSEFPALDSATWARNWALYQDEKIGMWRGTVWPYLNTFGMITSLYSPVGTTCLSVGAYKPGSFLMAGWATSLLAILFSDLTGEEKLMGWFIIQGAGKMTDFLLGRHHVLKHNRALLEKYHLTLLPQRRGGVLAISF
jgi:hypothetical protein